MDMPSDPGTYVLVMQCDGRKELAVGSLGRRILESGWYLYVGSALA